MNCEKQQMKISIITVAYNSSKTIRKTIESVLSQTYSSIEFIVVDGASLDNTINIVKDYELNFDGRLKWISESDKGLYDAMNKGIKMATGNLIGILNSDDIFNSNTVIEEIVNFHKANNVEVSVGNIIQRNEKGRIIRFYSSKHWKPEKIKIGFMPPHPSIFLKRELFDMYGFYNLGFKIGADYELVTRLFLKNSINWKYSGITTTSMLIGGVSSSGLISYQLVTKEIEKALTMNRVAFSPFKIKMRFFWKIMGLLIK